MTVIEVNGIEKAFGGVRVLEDVDLATEAGAVTGLIGPNGAGKSTLANIISGFLAADGGRVSLDGVDVTAKSVHARARLGLGRTYQNLELFGELSVEENVLLGLFRRQSFFGRWLSGPGESERREVREILAQLELEELRNAHAGELAFGHAKLVEPARMVAMEPKALVMDEPAAGLTSDDVRRMSAWIRQVADSGVSVLLIEHNMSMVMSVADHIYVLDRGHMIASGPPDAVRRDPQVIEAYLGAEASW